MYLSKIDIYITKIIYRINSQKFSKNFSEYIIFFNILINAIILIYVPFYLFCFRYFIELFIINFCCKCLLDRPRPRDSLFLNNKYYGINDIKLSRKWSNNQSFPSGHVATVYCTYRLICYLDWNYLSIFYKFLIYLTIFCRINLGAHYLSDCVFSLFICSILYINV